MGKFQIFQDGRAAGSAPVSGSDFVTKDYISSNSIWIPGSGSSSVVLRHGRGGQTALATGEGAVAHGGIWGGYSSDYATLASGESSHAEGIITRAEGKFSHVEGSGSVAQGYGSHAEGNYAKSVGPMSHAEGSYTSASGYASHAEGSSSQATGFGSHAEGSKSLAVGTGSHAEGKSTVASGNYSHAEGNWTSAQGYGSHAEGSYTTSSNYYEHAQGKYNRSTAFQIFSIGVGDNTSRRKNAISVITGSGATPSASIYVYGVGSYDGTNPTPGTNDIAAVISKLTGSVASASYNSTDKKIYFYDNTDTAVASVDATDFIKDGMVDSVAVSGSYLVLTFNTDAGKEPVSMSLTQIFNPDNYYTKSDVDTLLTTMSVGDVNVIEAVEFNGTASTINNKTASISIEIPEGALIIRPIWSASSYDEANDSGSYRFAPGTHQSVLDAHQAGRPVYLILGPNHEDPEVQGDFSESVLKLYEVTNWDNMLYFGSEVGYFSQTYSPAVQNCTLNQWDSGDWEIIPVPASWELEPVVSWVTENSASIPTESVWVRGAGSGSAILSGSMHSADGALSTAEGGRTNGSAWTGYARGVSSHIEGAGTEANGEASHAEGFRTVASGSWAHAEGSRSLALGSGSHTEGTYTTASGNYSHAEGSASIARGIASHAEGFQTVASGNYSHAEGRQTIASSGLSHAEGSASVASGWGTHAEGFRTTASGEYSHAEGWATEAMGSSSHAEGSGTQATNDHSHAEGQLTTARGGSSHAEGLYTLASQSYTHAEGLYTTASGWYSHVEGSGSRTLATATGSHAEGQGTIASNNYEHAQGKWNATASSQVFSVGVGTGNTTRQNAVSIITGSGTVPSASIYVYGVGTYDGTNPQPGVNDLATVIASLTGSQGGDAPLIIDVSSAPWTDGGSGSYSEVSGEADGYWTVDPALFTQASEALKAGKDVYLYSLNTYGQDYNCSLYPAFRGFNEFINFNSGYNSNAGGVQAIEFHPNGNIFLKTLEYVENDIYDYFTWGPGEGSGSAVLTDWDSEIPATATGQFAVAQGYAVQASGSYSHAEGYYTLASGTYSHAEGNSAIAVGDYSHAEGYDTTASGMYSHAEGQYAIAEGNGSHAEGSRTSASANYAHAEGREAIASGNYAHAEGFRTIASGMYSHAEGSKSLASGQWSHAEGGYTTASATYAHAEGSSTQAIGSSSHAEGSNTVASNDYEHAQGSFNATASSQIFSVGVGDTPSRRKNAISVITGSNPSASIYIYGVGSYNGTNPQPGTNDIASVIKQISASIGSGSGITSESDPIYLADSASLKNAATWVGSNSASLIASGTLAKNVTAITASLIASASVAKTASSSAAALSAKSASWDALVGLPAVTAADNGKILRVVNGAWALVDPVTVYSGQGAPDSALGQDGDIYLQS